MAHSAGMADSGSQGTGPGGASHSPPSSAQVTQLGSLAIATINEILVNTCKVLKLVPVVIVTITVTSIGFTHFELFSQASPWMPWASHSRRSRTLEA